MVLAATAACVLEVPVSRGKGRSPVSLGKYKILDCLTVVESPAWAAEMPGAATCLRN